MEFDNEAETRSCDTDIDSGEESNGPEWYNNEELDDDDQELIDSGSNQVFCFETDHAALKGNNDYHNLIKTLAILEAQRIKTIEDIVRLERLRRKVKDYPREYLKKFLSGDTSDIPSRIKVEEVPKIDFSKYDYKTSSKDNAKKTNKTAPVCKVENVSPESGFGTSKAARESYNNMTVRGRMFDQSKPQTFNQLWTAEEQLRLEELLLEFPPEKNENNRWRKIARALGNRTTQQVCSRVQKYFKKLNKVGLPIPGHQLKSNNMTKLRKKIRKKRALKNSTFFPTQHFGTPLQFDGCEEDEQKSRLPVLTPELKAEIIEKVIEFKRKDAQLAPFSHPGIKCIGCGEMPLGGTRWRCLICQTVSLCSDCVVNQLNAVPPVHPPSHPLEPLANPTLSHWDPDYMPDSFQSNNYLDPNFVTANVV